MHIVALCLYPRKGILQLQIYFESNFNMIIKLLLHFVYGFVAIGGGILVTEEPGAGTGIAEIYGGWSRSSYYGSNDKVRI